VPVTIALAHGLAGRVAAAHAALEPVTAADWRALPRSTRWTGYVSGLGWLADLCDTAEPRRRASAARARRAALPTMDRTVGRRAGPGPVPAGPSFGRSRKPPGPSASHRRYPRDDHPHGSLRRAYLTASVAAADA
jgi:hypothetical protein